MVVSVSSRKPPRLKLNLSLSGLPASANAPGAAATSSSPAAGIQNRGVGRVMLIGMYLVLAKRAAAVVFVRELSLASQGEGRCSLPNIRTAAAGILVRPAV